VHSIPSDDPNSRTVVKPAQHPSDGERLREVIERVSDAFVALDRTWHYTYVNARAAQLFGRRPEDLVGKHIWTEFPEGVGQKFQRTYEKAMAEQRPIFLEEYYPPYDRWFENRIFPSAEGLTIYFHDITVRKKNEALLTGQKQVLQMVAMGEALNATLETLLRVVEAQAPEMLCSVLLLDADGVHVRHGAAPSLPAEFSRAIDGLPIGPRAGSCGTAAFRREAVIVEDILSDPLWDDYRAGAVPFGLRACWSTPIIDAEHRVLGTFAIYYRKPGRPTEQHHRLIEIATQTAAVAISRDRAETALRESEARYSLVERAVNDGIWDWNLVTQTDYLSPKWKEMLGYDDHELPNHEASFFGLIHPDDQALVGEAVRAHLEERKPYRIELRLRHKAGHYCWVLSRGQAVRDTEGRPVRMVGSITDIAARRAAAEKIREQLDELLRWQAIMLGREERIQQLKAEVNQLLRAHGELPRYAGATTP
jgi:PAS domain S-box-containing protein